MPEVRKGEMPGARKGEMPGAQNPVLMLAGVVL